MSFLETLMEKVGDTKVPYYARESVGFRAIVQRTSEFARIEGLPRRHWEDVDYTKIINDELCIGDLRLWSIQCAALAEIALNRGAFLPIGVGLGKTFVSLLAPLVLNAERPVLFVPAQLRDQTNQHVLPLARKHFKLHPRLRVIGYSELSLAKNATMLEDIQPDVIICDECHALKNKNAGRTRRMVRYFREHPETVCVAMSGTVSNRSIKDFAHILEWCLKGNTPLPRTWRELSNWADAVDEGVEDDKRAAPGALSVFCVDGENVRQGFRRRLVETPAVVASKESDLGVSLRIQKLTVEVPHEVQVALARLRTIWETPNGDPLVNAVDLWRHARELALGFWYRWDPAPPREWLDARREWKKYVRETLKNNRRGLDTELQVWNECARETFPRQEWLDWKNVKNTFRPNTVAEWISDFAIKECCRWLYDRTIDDQGIAWVEHVAFGEALAKHFSYFGAGDSRILSTDETGIVASISAHGQGKNLQRYSRNLVVSPPTSGKAWEQLLGRTHREGQKADEVVVDVMLHTPELEDSFAQARADAIYLEDALGNRQKLNYADVVI